MNIIIFTVVLIELLFLILGCYYLTNKTKIRHIYKYLMILMYFANLTILNFIIINLYSYNHIINYNKNEFELISKEIIKLKKEIEGNKLELDRLNDDINENDITELS